MQFERNHSAEKTGRIIGTLLAYTIFTTILFFIVNWRHDVMFVKVLAFTLLLMVIGESLKKVLR